MTNQRQISTDIAEYKATWGHATSPEEINRTNSFTPHFVGVWVAAPGGGKQESVAQSGTPDTGNMDTTGYVFIFTETVQEMILLKVEVIESKNI